MESGTATRRPAGPWWVPAVWGIAWAGFGGLWALLLSMVLNWAGRSPTILHFVSWSALASGACVAGVVAKHGGHPLVARVTRYALKGALVAGIALGLAVLGLYGQSAGWMLRQMAVGAAGAFAYGYLGPLALGLAGAALRLGWKGTGGSTAGFAAAAYVVAGLLLLFPFPPISRDTYNPVGLFFPIWGFGVPFAVVVLGLCRFGKRNVRDAPDQDKV